MRSLKLKLEELSVESFEVAGAAPAAGTVRGHDSVDQIEAESKEKLTCDYSVCYYTCNSCPTGMGPACCV